VQDFAYLFPDSVAAWLEGRGDARFQRYEKHYRADRAAAQSHEAFDLQRSNVRFAQKFGSGRGQFAGVWVSKSRAFGALAIFLILLWGGTLLLSSVGATQPVAVAAVLGVVFVALRVKHFRARAKHP
jgi:Flp pilus assembly protein TadB